MADEKVISQADIDAMLATDPKEEAAPAEPTMAAALQVAAKAVSQAKAAQVEAKAQEEALSPDTGATVAQTRATPTATEKVMKAAPAPSVARQTPTTIETNGEVGSIVDDLAKRVGRIEKVLGGLDQLQKTVIEANDIIRQHPQDFQSAVNQLQELNEQVEDISVKLRSTLGYDIGEIFQCNCCDSKNLVAIRVKCTDCGQENWWGWWSKE